MNIAAIAALGLLLLSSGKRSSHLPSYSSPQARTISTTLPATKTKIKLYLPPSGGAVRELVVFLHGDNTKPQTLDEITTRHDLAAQIARCARGPRWQTAWVAPYSTGKCDHFNELFSSPTKAKAFFDGVLAQIAAQGFSVQPNVPLVLAGQSRGRVPIRKLLALLDKGEPVYWDRVKEVYLFDALYGAEQIFADFALRPDTRLWTAYGVSTAKGAQQLYKSIKGRTQKRIYSNLDLGGALPSIPDEIIKLTGQDKASPLGFVSSPVPHKFTARNYLAALMS